MHASLWAGVAVAGARGATVNLIRSGPNTAHTLSAGKSNLSARTATGVGRPQQANCQAKARTASCALPAATKATTGAARSCRRHCRRVAVPGRVSYFARFRRRYAGTTRFRRRTDEGATAC